MADFIVFAQTHTHDIYYDNGGNGRGGGRGVRDDNDGRSQQERDRDARAARRTKFGRQASDIPRSQSPNFADMILGLWMQNARKTQHKARAMKTDRTREKVQSWLKSAE